METHTIQEADLRAYETYLRCEERAEATVRAYLRCLRRFCQACGGEEIGKQTVLDYKSVLLHCYLPGSVNGAIAALNGSFAWKGWHDCRIKPVRVQRRSYLDPRRALNREEYFRLVKAAQQCGRTRLALLLQTICATGIRVSEVRAVTVEALHRGRLDIRSKGKCRTVFLPVQLCRKLLHYCRQRHIAYGCVFVTSTGRPLDRSNIWSMMKSLCKAADVEQSKVFPHNLRHLFARCFYQKEKDLEHLATILGHSNINTTRIYTMTDGTEHRRQVERLNLLL